MSKWKRICAGFFIVCLYMYCCWRSSRHLEERAWIPLTGVIPPLFYVCSKPEPAFPTPYVVASLFVVREVIVCFVDISGMFDHHCLKFLFIVLFGTY